MPLSIIFDKKFYVILELLCRTTKTDKEQAIYESYDDRFPKTHQQAINGRTGAKTSAG